MEFQTKPFSQACENNKRPISHVLSRYVKDNHRVLEIGSGTGQHATYFAEQFPSIAWQPSDRAENIQGIELWRQDVALDNVLAPLVFDVLQDNDWQRLAASDRFDLIYSANTLHIMSWETVQRWLSQFTQLLSNNGLLLIYGPFNYNNEYTSDSNAEFDAFLKQRNPQQGIRNFEAVDALCRAQGCEFVKDHEMPANNRLLAWQYVN